MPLPPIQPSTLAPTPPLAPDPTLPLTPDPSPTQGTGVYDPGIGSAPPALVAHAHLILDIIAWSATAACVAGFLITAAMMAISHHRGGGSDHFANLGKVATACIVVATAGPIVQFLT
jgi:hypothetical protein